MQFSSMFARVALLFLAAPFAHASTPAEDFASDQLLSQAIHEVGEMNADQLDAFVEYLSICGASAEAQDKELRCEVATTRFEIKNAGALALNKLISAIELHSRLVSRRWKDAAADQRSTLANYIERSVAIFKSLRKGAAAQYIYLRPGSDKVPPNKTIEPTR